MSRIQIIGKLTEKVPQFARIACAVAIDKAIDIWIQSRKYEDIGHRASDNPADALYNKLFGGLFFSNVDIKMVEDIIKEYEGALQWPPDARKGFYTLSGRCPTGLIDVRREEAIPITVVEESDQKAPGIYFADKSMLLDGTDTAHKFVKFYYGDDKFIVLDISILCKVYPVLGNRNAYAIVKHIYKDLVIKAFPTQTRGKKMRSMLEKLKDIIKNQFPICYAESWTANFDIFNESMIVAIDPHSSVPDARITKLKKKAKFYKNEMLKLDIRHEEKMKRISWLDNENEKLRNENKLLTEENDRLKRICASSIISYGSL